MTKIIFISLLSIVLITTLSLGGLWVYVVTTYQSRIVEASTILPGTYDVAIVFGAGVWDDGPSPVLYDRVETAADLYKSGIVKKLLLTGDNRHHRYNEPEAMRKTAVSLGVPESALVMDYAGRRTYDSCYRSMSVFGVRKAILVTQKFHLPRALYLCDTFGLEAIGIAADRQNYLSIAKMKWTLREGIAIVRAWVNVHIIAPKVIL